MAETRTTASGLVIEELDLGAGAEARAGQIVSVHYTGWLTDGSKFDSSVDRNDPFDFPLGRGYVIPGWDEGVAGMKVGGRRRITIPPDLAYGKRGAGGVIGPDETLIFVDTEEKNIIRHDQAECMGCLSQCAFSSWADNEKNTTGRLADPRSFCIQKTLQDIAHGGPVEQNLMFAGHAAFRFKDDPFYSNGFVPTVKQLVDRILTGA